MYVTWLQAKNQSGTEYTVNDYSIFDGPAI